MDWQALRLSLELAASTVLVLIPIGILLARLLAFKSVRAKPLVEALVALPLILPPTVIGFYVLVALGGASPAGQAWMALTGRPLVFNFEGLLIASILFNLPFAVQPLQRAFDAVPQSVREAAWVSGLSGWETFWRIELPLAWPGLLAAVVLTFAHTLGEFGVVLMVGGSIPGETKTIAISIYDQVQAFDMHAAGVMSLALLLFSFVAIAVVYAVGARVATPRG